VNNISNTDVVKRVGLLIRSNSMIIIKSKRYCSVDMSIGSLQNTFHLAVYLIFSLFSLHVQVKKSIVFKKH